MKLQSTTFAAACMVLASTAQALPITRYHAVDLQALAGQPEDSQGLGIASNGYTAGYSYHSSEGAFRAVRNAGGGIENLGGAGSGLPSSASAINAGGTAVGLIFAADGSKTVHAAMFSGGTVTDLFGGSPYESNATGINNSGQIAGSFTHYFDGFGGSISSVFRLTGGTLLEIAPLGGDRAEGKAINEAGQVVGNSTFQAGLLQVHGFFFDGSTTRDIGALVAGGNSFANAINDVGQVAGTATAADGKQHAVLYQNGGLVDLGLLPGSSYSDATGINDSGLIVGTADGLTGRHGWLFDGTQIIDLATLINDGFDGWRVADINGINDAGQIVGTAVDVSGINHAFRFDPIQAINNVPEPGSLALLLAALGAALLAAAFNPRRA